MKPSKRIFFTGIVIELLLAAIGYYLLTELAAGHLKPSTNMADAASTVTSVLGAVMGGLAGLLLVVYIVLRRRGA